MYFNRQLDICNDKASVRHLTSTEKLANRLLRSSLKLYEDAFGKLLSNLSF